MDETIEDDPFRVILFADIKDCLFQFPQSVGNPQSWLVDGFLLFCRLPPITYDHSHWLSDAFVKDDIVATDLSVSKCLIVSCLILSYRLMLTNSIC